MTRNLRARKPVYFKPGDWLLNQSDGVWWQREPTGSLWLCGSGGIFAAINLEKDTDCEITGDQIVLGLAVKDIEVAMGELMAIKPYLPTTLQKLRRTHPGLMQPSIRAWENQELLLSYGSGLARLDITARSAGKKTQLDFNFTTHVEMTEFWRKRPPISEGLASFGQWYVQTLIPFRSVRRLPELLNFTEAAKPYLANRALDVLQQGISALVKEQLDQLDQSPAGVGEFKTYARASAYLSWYNSNQVPTIAWHQHLFDSKLEKPRNLKTAVMALATPINPL